MRKERFQSPSWTWQETYKWGKREQVLPISSILLTVSAILESKMSCVSSTRRSSLYSRKGFPISSIVAHKALTFFWNVACTPIICSWWRKSGPLLCHFFVSSSEHLNSLIRCEISGPHTIQRNNWQEFSVKPIVLPLPLTILLFCWCAWSIGIDENAQWDFCTTKCPFPNSVATDGASLSSDFISCMCTGSHLA